MRKPILLLLFFLSFLSIYAQTYQKLYTENHSYGILSGCPVAAASHNNTAFFLKHTLNIADSTGTIISSTPMNINPTLMLGTFDGGFVFASKLAFQYSSLTKSDSAGNVLWQVNLPDSSTNIIQMRVDNAGNTYLLADSGIYQSDYFLQKYNANGSLLWSKMMDDAGPFAVNNAGGIFIAGQLDVRSLNANGDSIWQQNYNLQGNTFPLDITLLPSGNIVLLYGYYQGSYFIPKLYQLSSTGALMDSMALPGYASPSYIWQLNTAADGSLAVYYTSSSQGSAVLTDVNPFGTVNWQRTFLGDGNEQGVYMCPLPNGFIISGDTAGIYSYSYPYQYNSAVFIDRLDLSGQYYNPTSMDTSFGTSSAYGFIDTNDVAASFSNDGNLFNSFLVPNPGVSTTAVASATYVANIWVAGKSNGTLYSYSEMYSSQYMAGPSGTLPQDADKWNYIWQISRTDVLSVKNDFDLHHAITQPVPASILSWPAKGNAYATGNSGVSLTVDQDAAPFYDRNGDGIYNFCDGDYAMLSGDKMFWWINNDAGSQSQNPMGIDRRYSVYEYECTGDTNLDNTVFLSVSIKNQSNRAYDSVTIGTFADMPLGCPNDDRTGCIPSLNSFYVYKGYVPGGSQQGGVTCDEGTVCPTSEVGYGCNLPIISATFLNDTMKCYQSFENGASAAFSLPSTDLGFYRYMNGEWNDGAPFTYAGGTTPYPFAFPGNPADSTQWSELNPQPGPSGARRSIAAIGAFSLAAGDTMSFDMAFIFHADSFNNIPDISDSSIVNRHIDSISRYYASETFPCWFDSSKLLTPGFYNVGIHEIASGPVFSVIPNPNNGNFNIHFAGSGLSQYSVTVTDMLGRVVYYTPFGHSPDQMVQMSSATSGVYSVTIEADNYRATKKVVITK